MPFTSETAREAVAKSSRLQNLSPERRSEIARRAIRTRWYRVRGTDMERMEAYLRQLAKITARAIDTNNDDRAIKAINAMATWERLRLDLTRSAGKPWGPALEAVPGLQESLPVSGSGEDLDRALERSRTARDEPVEEEG